jgi:hypothetical protein
MDDVSGSVLLIDQFPPFSIGDFPFEVDPSITETVLDEELLFTT